MLDMVIGYGRSADAVLIRELRGTVINVQLTFR